MTDLQTYLLELQKEGYLKDIDHRMVFRNFDDLYRCNLQFWRVAIMPLIVDARTSGAPLDPTLMANGFDNIDQWSRYYIKFNLEYSDSHAYVQRKQKESELFREFVSVCRPIIWSSYTSVYFHILLYTSV